MYITVYVFSRYITGLVYCVMVSFFRMSPIFILYHSHTCLFVTGFPIPWIEGQVILLVHDSQRIVDDGGTKPIQLLTDFNRMIMLGEYHIDNGNICLQTVDLFLQSLPFIEFQLALMATICIHIMEYFILMV